MNIKENLAELLKAVMNNDLIEMENLGALKPLTTKEIEDLKILNFKESFINNYSPCSGFLVKYSLNMNNSGKRMHLVSLLRTEQVIMNREGEIYDKDEIEPDDPIRNFHVVDDFANETCVGIYAGENATNSLYYYRRGEDSAQFLGLDLCGYIEMMVAAKGYRYWQKAILDIRKSSECTETKDLKRDLPILFSGWSWDEFVAKYQSLRIQEGTP
jgi:hypothetical protein